MSTATGAITLPHRTPHPATRRVLEIVLVLAVSLGVIAVLAAVRDPAVPTRVPFVTQDAPTHGRHPDTIRMTEDLPTHGRHQDARARAEASR